MNVYGIPISTRRQSCRISPSNLDRFIQQRTRRSFLSPDKVPVNQRWGLPTTDIFKD